ncbi:MAG: hypothetical protein ACREVS_08080 [Burkholderiales bacterium]
MPVYPLTLGPLVMSGNYPHMAKHDAQLWERFIERWSSTFTGVAYDVALGGVIFEDPAADPALLQGWRYSTAVKVDAVLVGEGFAWTVEVRPGARLGSLGNALGYAVLFELDGALDLPITPTVVTDECSRDVEIVAEALGVALFQLGREAPPALPPPAVRRGLPHVAEP